MTIGGPACHRPYCASVFNISGTSFGALGADAIVPPGAILAGRMSPELAREWDLAQAESFAPRHAA